MEILDLPTVSKENSSFRRVVFTQQHLQVVLMSLEPQDSLSPEERDEDAVILVEEGEGQFTLDGEVQTIRQGHMAVAAAQHKFALANNGPAPLKLVVVLAPKKYLSGQTDSNKVEAIMDPYNEANI